jgi:hypothetical protein
MTIRDDGATDRGDRPGSRLLSWMTLVAGALLCVVAVLLS